MLSYGAIACNFPMFHVSMFGDGRYVRYVGLPKDSQAQVWIWFSMVYGRYTELFSGINKPIKITMMITVL